MIQILPAVLQDAHLPSYHQTKFVQTNLILTQFLRDKIRVARKNPFLTIGLFIRKSTRKTGRELIIWCCRETQGAVT